MKYIIENSKKQNDYKQPIDAFLEGLAPSLKNLSPYYQHLAKGKIFSVVQELECQAFFGSPVATPHTRFVVNQFFVTSDKFSFPFSLTPCWMYSPPSAFAFRTFFV
jgi:hypothetical protein